MTDTDMFLDALLGLPKDLKDEVRVGLFVQYRSLIRIQEKSDRLSALITSAVYENHAKYTLEQIYRALSNSGSASLLVRTCPFIHLFHYLDLFYCRIL